MTTIRYLGRLFFWWGLAFTAASLPALAGTSGPSFDCARAEAGSVEALVCSDGELSRLDRQMADVYAAARAKAADENPPVLQPEQRGWIRGRDDCWKSDNPRDCTARSYRLRIAELQARYRLVPEAGPVLYRCPDPGGVEVVATFFRTDPPTLIAERGDQTSFMVLQPAGSGARYEGANESLWEHHGEARITWGYGAPEEVCRRAP